MKKENSNADDIYNRDTEDMSKKPLEKTKDMDDDNSENETMDKDKKKTKNFYENPKDPNRPPTPGEPRIVGWLITYTEKKPWGEEFKLRAGENIIGRKYIDDEGFSRRQFKILHKRGKKGEENFTIIDLDSKHMLYVNDNSVKEHELKDGDVIEVDTDVNEYKFIFKCIETEKYKFIPNYFVKED